MNREYIYHDGKALVIDENNAQKNVDYYDNLDKVLVQENLIETMEEKIKELEKESADFKMKNKKHYIPYRFLEAEIMPVLLVLTTLLIGNGMVGGYPRIMQVCATFIKIFPVVILPFAAMLEYIHYNDYKMLKQKEKGINNELDFLKKQIEKEKEYLETLKREKTHNNVNDEFKMIEVDDLQKLKELRSKLELYYILGYNDEKYYKYYQKGCLDEKLEKDYNEADIQLVKEYLEEKGTSLKKTRTTKN